MTSTGEAESSKGSNATSTAPGRKKQNAVQRSFMNVGRRIKGRFRSSSKGSSSPTKNYGTVAAASDPEGIERNNTLRIRNGNGSNNNDPDNPSNTVIFREGVQETSIGGRDRRLAPQTRQELHPSHFENHRRSREPYVVAKFESLLRLALALAVVFFVGTYFPLKHDMAREIVQYVAVAWVTAIVLYIAVKCEEHKPEDDTNEPFMTQERDAFVAMEEGTPLLEHCPTDDVEGSEASPEKAHHRRTISGASSTKSVFSIQPATVIPHPSLEPLYIVDAMVKKRVNLNSPKNLHVMDCEYFTGTMMSLIRTPDVDDPSAPIGSPDNAAAVDYLRGKQRRFEFQFQCKLKKIPTGRLYFACELEESIKLGMLQRAFVGAAMAFVKSKNPFFHYSITGSADEPPHMAFPFFSGMDRVVATPPGEDPPLLGRPIEESVESQKNRAKGNIPFEWNLEDTYTFALWSAYCDFSMWKVLNLPGIRPFDLQSVLGRQPIQITVYEMDGNDTMDDKEPHVRLPERTLLRIELCHEQCTGLGPVAKEALEAASDNNAGPGAILFTESADSTDDSDHGEGSADMTDRESAHGANSQEYSDEARSLLQQVPDAFPEADESDESSAEEDAAELGEGIYIRSGDPIVMKEVPSDEGMKSSTDPCFVAVAGGFCILQEQAQEQQPYKIVIEKVKNRFLANQGIEKTKSERNQGSSLIKNGDTVMLKLIKGETTMYLTIHRGWWLKWASASPAKNGHFIVHTTMKNHPSSIHSTQEEGNDQHSNEFHEESLLTFGGMFWLQHKRWSKFSVGVASEGSATFGGRMLGLFEKAGPTASSKPNTSEASPVTDVAEPVVDEKDEGPDGSKSPGQWMKPIIFQALDAASVTSLPSSIPEGHRRSRSESKVDTAKLLLSLEHSSVDAPIWIEMLNRTDRARQLAFGVRIVTSNSSFLRIRTGRQLAEVMRKGLHWRNSLRSSSSQRRTKGSGQRSRLDTFSTTAQNHNTPQPVSNQEVLPSSPSRERAATEPAIPSYSGNDEPSFEEPHAYEEVESDDEFVQEGGDVDTSGVGLDESNTKKRGRPRKMIGKLAKKVKATTVKAGKGTVAAGKSIVPIRPKNPPAKEPAQKATARSRRRTEKDLHAAVSTRMLKMDKDEIMENIGDDSERNQSTLAGELSAPEQSRKTVSTMLEKMSTEVSFGNLLNSKINFVSENDEWFLSGKAIDLGVVPAGEFIANSVIARCIWNSHWREEWCGLTAKSLILYAPLTDTSSLELSLADIQYIRLLADDEKSPLPGLPVLVVETAWKCNYFAFANEDSRASFYEQLGKAKDEFDEQASQRQEEKDLWKARFWQGFRSSYESSLSGGKDKWAEISSGRVKKRRLVLNNRRMSFDLQPFPEPASTFSEDLLSVALSFRLESLLEHPEAFSRFLDAVSQLQNLPIQEQDFSSADTFCLFVNLYHCLLQHALLLTVNGPLTKRSCSHFMRTSCYEIGGDVFSLAELNICVIRGRMTRPSAPKPPFFDISKKSQVYQCYALGFTTNRVNFILNTGDTSFPRKIPVLSPNTLEKQLSEAASVFCSRNLTLDESKRTIYVPKVCEVFKGDFSPDSSSGSNQDCLKYCLGFIDDSLATSIQSMLQDTSPVYIKFQPSSEQYHSTLQALPQDANYDPL